MTEVCPRHSEAKRGTVHLLGQAKDTGEVVSPKNWVHLAVAVKQKETTKPESGRRKDFLTAANKENTRDLSQGNVSPKPKLGKFSG